MPDLNAVRTSLEVGFPEGKLPEAFVRYRGRQTRQIAARESFPFEDAQFEVVIMNGAAVSSATVREAHRVLKADGSLFFTVNEKTKKQDGYTLPELYAIMRDGFNLVEVHRPAWWYFGRLGNTLTVRAQKKHWKSLNNTFRPLT